MVGAATGMSREDARSALADIRTHVNAARDNPSQALPRRAMAFGDRWSWPSSAMVGRRQAAARILAS